MNQRALVAAAAVSLLSTLLMATPAAAQAKEKCYGIAKAGQNDCSNLAGTHSCSGQSTLDNDKGEWKYVAKGTCATMKGMTAAEAKKASMPKDDMKKDEMKKEETKPMGMKEGEMKKDDMKPAVMADKPMADKPMADKAMATKTMAKKHSMKKPMKKPMKKEMAMEPKV
jgi:uncharacterized membrane protein